MEKKDERKIKYWVQGVFHKRKEKGTLSNLARNETS